MEMLKDKRFLIGVAVVILIIVIAYATGWMGGAEAPISATE